MQQRGVKENVMNLKACGRCGGDQIREEVMGDAELVCLQCGQRESAPSDKLPRYMTVARKRARRAPRAA
jgi:DNA-directed RNA polymerase subunit RPC12/RpoP